MTKQKVSLEEILNEYSNSDSRKNTRSDNEVRDIIMNHSRKNRINDGTNRRPNPANDYKPSDIGKPDISFINAINIDRLRTPENKPPSNNGSSSVNQNKWDSDSDDYTPKIRRMSDSTRAREIEKSKKNKKRKKSDFTYKRESPEGEYIYTPVPEKDKKKKKNISLSPQSINDTPITPAPRADITSINLSEDFKFDSDSLDIHIEQGENKKISGDFNCYGDARETRKSIHELKSSIVTRFTMLMVCTLLSIFISFFPMWSAVENPQGFTAFQIIIGMTAIIVSAPAITNGLKKFIKFKPDSDSAVAVTAVTVIVSAIIAFFTPELVKNGSVNIYVPVSTLALLFNSIGKFLIINRAERNFRAISKESERYGITCVSDDVSAETLTRGTMTDFPILASMHRTNFLTDFLKYTYSSDISDKFCRRSVPATVIVSAVVSAFITIIRQESISVGLSFFSMLICASSCIAMTLVSNLPLNNASKKLIKNKGIIFGYQSVDDFYDTNSVLVEAKDLFPEISVKLAGMKVFSDTKADEAMLEASSLANYAGSIMKGIFDDVTMGEERCPYTIENFSYEDSLGLCGWINNKRILFGSRELMTSHNIEGMPTKAKENEFTGDGKEVVYLSVSGNLSAMFVVELKAESNIKYWVNQLCKNNVHLIIKSVDSCVTLKRLSKVFDIPEEFMRIIPKKLHSEFDEQTKKSVRLSASMACSGRFSEFAQLIMTAKSLHSSAVTGLIVQSISILLGIGMGILIIISNSFGYIGMPSSAVLIYNLIFALITYLSVNIKKF